MDVSQPFAIAAAVGMAGFVAYFVKDVIGDLRKERDSARADHRAALEAGNKAIATVERLADMLEAQNRALGAK